MTCEVQRQVGELLAAQLDAVETDLRLMERPYAAAAAWDHKPCGTPAAARRHYRRREPLCEACKAANRRNRSARKAA